MLSKYCIYSMIWHCPIMAEFGKYITKASSEMILKNISQDPKVCILGDLNPVNLSPSQRHWINKLTSCCASEKILYNLKKRLPLLRKI